MSAVTLQCLLWNIDWLELNKGQPQPNIHKEGTVSVSQYNQLYGGSLCSTTCSKLQGSIIKVTMVVPQSQVNCLLPATLRCTVAVSKGNCVCKLVFIISTNSTSNSEKCRQAHAVHTCTVLTYNVSCCCFSLPCLPDKLAQKLIWSALRLLHNCIIIHCCRPQAVLAWSRFCARL